jgi:adenine-specific DNA-methyltransferase
LIDSPTQRKARGAFFTPPELSAFVAEWALRHPDDLVLEPSCGEAGFLLSASERLEALGASSIGNQMRGVEVFGPSATAAAALLNDRGHQPIIERADFFDVPSQAVYDAVIGNPPYVRYQNFAGAAREKGLRAAMAQGVRLTGLASSWAAFTVHAAQFLKPGGRLGLVLPAELLTVKYAAAVRQFLLGRFARVRLVTFDELLFPGVLEEVVLLLAEGSGGSSSFEVYQARDAAELGAMIWESDDRWTRYTPDRTGKWTAALLPPDAVADYRKHVTSGGFLPLIEWGETYLGAVTGNNRYFTLTAEQVRAAGLAPHEVLPISPPGSRHVRDLSFTDGDWDALTEAGEACYLFYPDLAHLSPSARRYIAQGEAAGYQTTYKCRNRQPWWRTPLVPQPDLFLTYMDQHRPRFATNLANAYHLNSLYGVTLSPPLRDLGRELVPLAAVNTLSMLGAEIVGRAYGGGMLKLEPKEADNLPMPSPDLVRAASEDLRRIQPFVSDALRRGDLTAAAGLTDQVLLTGHMGMSADTLNTLRGARETLFNRRASRGKSPHGA